MRHWFAVVLAALLSVASSPVLAQPVVREERPAMSPVDSAPAATSDDAGTIGQPVSGILSPRLPLVPTRDDDRTSVRSLFSNLGADLLQAARPDNALILIGTGAGAALIHPYDVRLTNRFATTRSFEPVFDAGQLLGGALVQAGGAAATYAVGRIVKHEKTALVGADLVRAQLVNTIFTQGLKFSINRTRPDGDPWSLPSGHASGTFASATVLHRHFGWKVGVPAYAVAAYVAGSRLQERRHFASDVIFGAGIGIVSGRIVTVGRGGTRFALAPMAVPGRGAGISFTRVAN